MSEIFSAIEDIVLQIRPSRDFRFIAASVTAMARLTGRNVLVRIPGMDAELLTVTPHADPDATARFFAELFFADLMEREQGVVEGKVARFRPGSEPPPEVDNSGDSQLVLCRHGRALFVGWFVHRDDRYRGWQRAEGAMVRGGIAVDEWTWLPIGVQE